MKTFWLITFLVPVALFSQGQLDNSSVVQLVKAGVSEEIILNMVRTQPSQFKVGAEEIVDLKKAGVSDKIVASMLSAKSPSSTERPLPTSLPEIIGVYAQRPEGVRELPVEVVNIKSGGMLKTMFTYGIAKLKINGTARGTQSSFTTTAPFHFMVRTADGTAPEEYELVPFTTKKDHREFVAGKGSITGTSIGVGDIAIPLKFERVDRNLYRTVLTELTPGEYGFIAPGTLSPTSAGKMYTFRVQ